MIGLLRQYPEEIEADLARFYSVDVGDYWRGDISARRLAVLLQALPEESATVKAQRGTPWTELLYLVAQIVDVVTYARADYINAHGGQSRPEPIPRPAGDEDDRIHQVHEALTDMMRGQPAIEAAPGDGRIYEPETETVH